MRKFKTSEDNRTNHIYYTAEGKKLVIKPGMVGNNGKAITEEMITILHKMDDEQVDADRREEYHCPVHYQAYSDGEGEDADDRNPYLCDTAADPLEQMLASINEQEHSEKLDRLKAALTTLTCREIPSIKSSITTCPTWITVDSLSLWQESADQAVVVLNGTFFTGSIRMSKVHCDSLCEPAMPFSP